MSELRSALEIALVRTAAHSIPPITEPMGKHWRQPDRFNIEIDATHALMSQADFERLAEYSCSMPTGAYQGKMWKCCVGVYARPQWPKDQWYWVLRWFGTHPDPNFVSNNQRRILIA